ncbi:MAG: YdcF family protein [Terracidiphilus sp.]
MALFAWAILARVFAPASNTNRTRFDVIIVLGTPADSDGNPTPEQLARTTEGVREYERDVAPRLIFTGGAAKNEFIEAQVMARTAEAQGIPASAIFIEPKAMDTIHNACYAVRILKAHGWRSAEVVTSAYHLPRAGLIFNRLPVEWRGHAAPPLEPESRSDLSASWVLETLKTFRYLTYANWAERCEP